MLTVQDLLGVMTLKEILNNLINQEFNLNLSLKQVKEHLQTMKENKDQTVDPNQLAHAQNELDNMNNYLLIVKKQTTIFFVDLDNFFYYLPDEIVKTFVQKLFTDDMNSFFTDNERAKYQFKILKLK